MKKFILLGTGLGLVVGVASVLFVGLLRTTARESSQTQEKQEKQKIAEECESLLQANSQRLVEGIRRCSGDITIDSGPSGIGLYDNLITDLKSQIPEIEAASPVIVTYGIIGVPGSDRRCTVQVLGIRLPEWAHVTQWQQGLFIQKGLQDPTFDPPLDTTLGRLEAEKGSLLEAIAPFKTGQSSEHSGGDNRLIQLEYSLQSHQNALSRIKTALPYQKQLRELAAQLDAEYAKIETGGASSNQETTEKIEEQLHALQDKVGYLAPRSRIILGSRIPGVTTTGDTTKAFRVMCPGQEMTLAVVPMGMGVGSSLLQPRVKTFSLADDQTTGVSTVDDNTVYVPFETVQHMIEWSAKIGADTHEVATPALCSQIHIRVDPKYRDGKQLDSIRDKVSKVVEGFCRKNPQLSSFSLQVQTWRERQAYALGSMEKQLQLMHIIFKSDLPKEDLLQLRDSLKQQGME